MNSAAGRNMQTLRFYKFLSNSKLSLTDLLACNFMKFYYCEIFFVKD